MKYSEMDLVSLQSLAEQKFTLFFEPLKVADIELHIAQIKDLEQYLDKLVESQEQINLPYWAKIWPASLLLSYFLLKYLPAEGKVLEIGAGLGICGLFLAAKGMEVTISDVEEDALLFAQINILKNNLQKKARVQKVDFTTAVLQEKYDYIIGSEVLYLEDTYRPLLKFFLKNLKNNSQSEVILAQNYTRKAKKFFSLAQKEFHIQEKTIGYKSQDPEDKEKFLCQIYRMRAKKHV
ncbi:MAG: hypothetical protein PWR24_1948 [Desulfonauticus sp.]|jgi:2-polyprenyl-3-methyl-5-hydroxy-6-metoxy-1,4-benzoquinol methylase|nr:MAG: Methyltransferase small [Desulfonauticus sp. 38_4375]MDK2922391.1 hypothetical protein [Desulfonauticus sp.]